MKQNGPKEKQYSHQNFGAKDKQTKEKESKVPPTQTPGMTKKKSCLSYSSAKKVSVHNVIFPEKNNQGEFVDNNFRSSLVRKVSQVSSMKQIVPLAEESKPRIEMLIVQQQTSEDHLRQGTIDRPVEEQSSIEASH